MGKGQEISRCELCLFFKPSNSAVGRCQRYPPTTTLYEASEAEVQTPYPWVKNSDWCGEFREKV